MLTVQRIEAIYAELEKYVVHLDPDPRGRGTAYLQDLIATCRNFLSDLDRLLREIHHEDHRVARELRLAETAFQLESDNLLANDIRVNRLPSIEDRKAMIGVLLREQRATIERLKTEAQDIKMVDKLVRHQHKQLTATTGDVKLQRSIIDAEIRTGAMYGDERVVAEMGGGQFLNEKDLDALFIEEQAVQKAQPVASVATESFDDVFEAAQLTDLPLVSPVQPLVAASLVEPAAVIEAPLTEAPDAEDQAIDAFLADHPDVGDIFKNL